MKWCCSLLKLLGRLLLSILFVLSVIWKVSDYDTALQYIASKGLAAVPFLLVGSVIIEAVGALSVIFGYKTRWGAALLFLYLIPTTVIFHDFWNAGEAEHQVQFLMFFKNLAIMGGLLYVIGAGPGCLSLDALCCRNRDETTCQIKE